VPKSINDFPLREKRPLNVSLNPKRLIHALDLKMHKVEDVCRTIVQKKFQRFTPRVLLDDSDSVWEDKGAKSISYFCKRKPVKVDRDLIQELKTIALRNGNKNIRLCLHDGPQAPFHNMVIVEHEGKYYPPHKHSNKGETFHIIEGKMAVFTFNEDSSIIDASILDDKENLIYRVGVDMYHAVMPLSNPVIYHESKPGPFIPNSDSIYPRWAPAADNIEEVTSFRQRLMEVLEKRCIKRN
jgi:glucose-6-phosphate isomerase